ncbi:MAG: hypothetical protein HC893_00465 [Chloroflexaceae bacterium]|nr:hypothetical protein [Chloroflexaceae bacterium]
MSEQTPAVLRERLEERKRLNLGEGRALLEMLEQAQAEIEQLKAQLTATESDEATAPRACDNPPCYGCGQ